MVLVDLRFDSLDIPEISKLHIHELKDGSLYLIGEKPLIHLYEMLLKKNNLVIAAYIDTKIIGYVTIIKNKPSILELITIGGWFNLVIKVFSSPRAINKILETFLFDRASYKAMLAYCKGSKALELSHFVVSKDYKSNGIGTKLIKYVQEIAVSTNHEYIYTTTHNERLSNFYVKNNLAKVICTRLIAGKIHQCLVWHCL